MGSSDNNDAARRAPKLDPETRDKLEQNRTVELQTSDLVDLAQSGQLDGRAIRAIVETHDRGEPKVGAEPKIIVDTEASIIVDPEVTEQAAPVIPVRVVAAVTRAAPQAPRIAEPPVPQRAGTSWLVIMIYVLAFAALAIALYQRFAN